MKVNLWWIVVACVFLLTGCFSAIDLAIDMTPQRNDVTVIEKNITLTKDNKTAVIYKERGGVSTQQLFKQKKIIKEMLEKNGINNYEFVDSREVIPDNCQYIMIIEQEGWSAKKLESGSTDLWVALSVNVLDAQTGDVLAKVAGSAADYKTFVGWDIKEMVGNLLEVMLQKIYS